MALIAIASAAVLGLAGWTAAAIHQKNQRETNDATATTFQPPPDSAIPNDQFGAMVKKGREIFLDPAKFVPEYVGNHLSCASCHLGAGRQAGAAPMWAAYVAFPAFRSKNGHVNSFAERLQGCFRYSMNGKQPPLGDPTLMALESYAYFLAKGAPTGQSMPGRGFPELPPPPQPADYARGATVYAQSCVACHGANGEGRMNNGEPVFPPLWGAQSFNWGAGMTSIQSAAQFIHANMPLGLGGTLSAQQAWDVATYIDSQTRPQDPRFNGDVAKTRAKYHNTKYSMYGKVVDGVVLGDPDHTPPAGTVLAQAQTQSAAPSANHAQ